MKPIYTNSVLKRELSVDYFFSTNRQSPQANLESM